MAPIRQLPLFSRAKRLPKRAISGLRRGNSCDRPRHPAWRKQRQRHTGDPLALRNKAAADPPFRCTAAAFGRFAQAAFLHRSKQGCAESFFASGIASPDPAKSQWILKGPSLNCPKNKKEMQNRSRCPECAPHRWAIPHCMAPTRRSPGRALSGKGFLQLVRQWPAFQTRRKFLAALRL